MIAYPGEFFRKFSPLAFINRRMPAAFRHENMTSSLLSLTYVLRGFQIKFLWWHGSVGSPMWLEHQTVRWHGSVGRAHRSHHGAQAPVALALIDQAKRDRWFESNCHHHSAALENQGPQFFIPSASLPRGSLFSGFTSAM